MGNALDWCNGFNVYGLIAPAAVGIALSCRAAENLVAAA
jgi:hypothetical protein